MHCSNRTLNGAVLDYCGQRKPSFNAIVILFARNIRNFTHFLHLQFFQHSHSNTAKFTSFPCIHFYYLLSKDCAKWFNCTDFQLFYQLPTEHNPFSASLHSGSWARPVTYAPPPLPISKIFDLRKIITSRSLVAESKLHGLQNTGGKIKYYNPVYL